VILGSVGDNFAAGMTGGMAFVYDTDGGFLARLNPDSVVVQRLKSVFWDDKLVNLIEQHAAETKSEFARDLLTDWDVVQPKFWQICPKEMLNRLRNPIVDVGTTAKTA
jgi:glutamate synthase (NADPH/NADH) large chain